MTDREFLPVTVHENGAAGIGECVAGSGIGRAHHIHLSTLANFTLPGDIAASRRYYAPDPIDPEIDVRPDGTISVPDGPESPCTS